MNKLFVPLLCCLAVARIYAQSAASEKETPPPGPMLARAPNFAKWNVTVKRQPSAKSGAAPDPKSSSGAKADETVYAVSKTGKAYVQEHTDSVGRKWTMWAWDRISATVWPETGAVILECNIPGLVAPDYTKTDFPDVAWVSELNFVKTTTYNGKKCLVFSQSATGADAELVATGPKTRTVNGQDGSLGPAPAAAASSSKVTQSAVIDFDTRLPLYAQDSKGTYTFAYLKPPDAPLQIPEEIQKAVKQQARVNADSNLPRARSY